MRRIFALVAGACGALAIALQRYPVHANHVVPTPDRRCPAITRADQASAVRGQGHAVAHIAQARLRPGQRGVLAWVWTPEIVHPRRRAMRIEEEKGAADADRGPRWHDLQSPVTPAVGLRKFPYPYRAMLALCSDADGTSPAEFIQIHRLLNTRANTEMGRGLGLDVGDSFFFYVGTDHPGPCDDRGTSWQDEQSYFWHMSSTRRKDASLIEHYARVGWIDAIHGLGDLSLQGERPPAPMRARARAAAHVLLTWSAPQLSIWINHGNRSNQTNFGSSNTSYQHGDSPLSPYHVTDLMIPAGVRYVWTRRDSAFGRATMIYPIRLRDGHSVWGFYRYTDDGYDRRGRIRWNWNPIFLHRQLTYAHLRLLVARQQYAIVAQHFGGNIGRYPFYGDNLDALHLLADTQARGRILVARTSRLLAYNEASAFVRYRLSRAGQDVHVDIEAIADPVLGNRIPTLADVRGLTFYLPARVRRAQIALAGKILPCKDIQINPADESGRTSVAIKWWPKDNTDWSLPTNSGRRSARGCAHPLPARGWNYTETVI